jgi:hypothetical protein
LLLEVAVEEMILAVVVEPVDILKVQVFLLQVAQIMQ